MGVVGEKVNINCLAFIIQQVERMDMTPCSEFFLPLTKQNSVILIATYSDNMLSKVLEYLRLFLINFYRCLHPLKF